MKTRTPGSQPQLPITNYQLPVNDTVTSDHLDTISIYMVNKHHWFNKPNSDLNLKPLLGFILILFALCPQILAQSEEPDTAYIPTAEIDSIIFESPKPITLEAISVIRFSSNAAAYVKWTAPTVSITGYTFRYKLSGATSWTTSSNSTLEKILSSLQLDTSYILEVLPTGVINANSYLASGLISTHPLDEPIIVSHGFFNELTAWFANDSETRTFCEFIEETEIHIFEKLAFLQKYVFDNESFTDGGVSSDFSDWYPSRFLTTLSVDECLPDWATDCRCQVISDGSNYASPGETDFLNAKINPKIVDKVVKSNNDKRTYVDRYESGAAKFIGLHQDESRGMEFEMSNLDDADDNTAETPAVSSIQFFLGCLDRDEGGGINTNLPEECDCQRPLHVSYSYTTRLVAMSEKKGCIWNKGAAAQAEDFAAVVVHDIKSGDLTALDAGTFMVSRRCDSGWNPDWWIALLNIAETVAGYYVTTIGSSGNNVPTSNQIGELFDAIEVLLGTPFSIQSGSCGTTEESRVLVNGINTLTLKPNMPIRISLFSAYYAKVRGYGCWKADAGIASDYYLLGVVESENTEDPECCADKFATYIVGSLGSESAPPPTNPSDVELDPVNNVQNRLNNVAYDLALYGSWYDHNINPFTGYIDDLVHEFDRLRGASCSIEIPYQKYEKDELSNTEEFKIGIDNTNISVNIEIEHEIYGHISMFDLTGRFIGVIYSGHFNRGPNNISIPVDDLAGGIYIVNCIIGDNVITYPTIVLK